MVCKDEAFCSSLWSVLEDTVRFFYEMSDGIARDESIEVFIVLGLR